jgi:hypothetical protein
MKKPSSGLGLGLWVAGGLVTAYLVNGLALHFGGAAPLDWVMSLPAPIANGLFEASVSFADLIDWTKVFFRT